MANRHSSFDPGDNDLLEFGISTAKSIPGQVAKAFNPLAGVFDKKAESSPNTPNKDKGVEKLMKDANKDKSTPLDFQKLQNKFADQDKIKLEAMRNRLFNMVKNDEEKAILERKREAEERKQKELQEEQEKKQKQLQAQQDQPSDVPQGKVRKQLGATAKKVVSDTRQEMKGNKGSG